MAFCLRIRLQNTSFGGKLMKYFVLRNTKCMTWLCSLSDKMSYCGISWSLVTVKLEVYIMASLWKLTRTSAALQSRCLSDLRVIIQFRIQISQLRDFARSYNKMSYLILKQGPGLAKHGIEWVWGVVSVRWISTTISIWMLSDIHLIISHKISQPTITEMYWKIT